VEPVGPAGTTRRPELSSAPSERSWRRHIPDLRRPTRGLTSLTTPPTDGPRPESPTTLRSGTRARGGDDRFAQADQFKELDAVNCRDRRSHTSQLIKLARRRTAPPAGVPQLPPVMASQLRSPKVPTPRPPSPSLVAPLVLLSQLPFRSNSFGGNPTRLLDI
jgi:hypothetical protein